jgi:tetraprenyl-beta-curcumene synthase
LSQYKNNGQVFPQNPIRLMYRVYRYILPEVKTQLEEWREKAERIPNQELQSQAIASITAKKFHCQGGAVYATANLAQRHVLIPLIVAFQTISDYLDNLCDRSTSLDPKDFRQLHEAMLDAIDPSASLKDYYAFRDEKEDGYLDKLVLRCQSCICMLPSYEKVQPYVRELVSYYCDLQVYKHIRQDERESELLKWWELHNSKHPNLHWNEFAAASGSTLGVFMLFLAASYPQLKTETALTIRHAYFPHVCSLHILLDYLIDQEEDRVGGDLNFCNYYSGMEQTISRIRYIVERAREDITEMDYTPFHRMIIEGLLALYLSDPKVRNQEQVRNASKQLMKNSPMTRMFFWINSTMIRKKS